jgi:alkaline phosphatase
MVSGLKGRRVRWCRYILFAAMAASVIAPQPVACATIGARNIILMVADGGGFNQFTAASYFEHGAPGQQVYDGPGWVKYGCTTYDSSGYYLPADMWYDFTWQQEGATDSSAAATAINTGVKTYDGAVNVNDEFNPLTTIAQLEDARGRATGAITTVEISHATPACVWAHNTSRDNYADIANEMIYDSGLDVIMGAGNPEYNNDGQPAAMTSQFVGGANTWSQLRAGTTGKGWTLIQSKADFELYAGSPFQPAMRLIGVARVNATLQEKRSADPLNTNVPDLAAMSMGGINVLSRNPDGFFLMIEGGAVDWANHDNRLDRMVQEFGDFNRAVESVVDWVETNSSWDQTLLIVTADHESGCLWGPDSDGETFNVIGNNGMGVLPDAVYFTAAHTNQLVPLYARGVGSELFAGHIRGTDTAAALYYDFSGQYVDNTDIFRVMNAVATSDFVCDPIMASDIDGDCHVDFADYAALADAWGQSPPSIDIVTDGVIDFHDMAQLTSDWLRCTRLPPGHCD